MNARRAQSAPRPVRLMPLVVVILLGLLISSCRSPGLPSGWSILDTEARSARLVSIPIILLADNQLHNLDTDEVKLYRSGFGDKISQAAIRPIQLDYFGPDLLRYVFQKGEDELEPIFPDPLVHLGDACDLACTGEFATFSDIMRTASKGWVMAPGNHDCMFYGNAHPTVFDGVWKEACQGAGEPLTKDQFVRRYLAALVLQTNLAAASPLANYMELQDEPARDFSGIAYDDVLKDVASQVPLSGDWPVDTKRVDGAPLNLKAISWKIDQGAPARSYVVQLLDLSRKAHSQEPNEFPHVFAIILDTCQYSSSPSLVPIPPFTVNPALTGNILPDQLQAILRWVQSYDDSHAVWIIMGHHPYSMFSRSAKARFNNIRKRTRNRLYVSAHMHHGEYRVHRNDDDTLLELSVGSMLDWPMEYRTFRIKQKGKRVICDSDLRRVHEQLAEHDIPRHADIWQANPEDRDYYISHDRLISMSSAEAERLLKDAQLTMHRRMICKFHTASCASQYWPEGCNKDSDVFERIKRTLDGTLAMKTKLCRELEVFDRNRKTEHPQELLWYRLSQAIWASKYDGLHSRRPLVGDSAIAFPK